MLMSETDSGAVVGDNEVHGIEAVLDVVDRKDGVFFILPIVGIDGDGYVLGGMFVARGIAFGSIRMRHVELLRCQRSSGDQKNDEDEPSGFLAKTIDA